MNVVVVSVTAFAECIGRTALVSHLRLEGEIKDTKHPAYEVFPRVAPCRRERYTITKTLEQKAVICTPPYITCKKVTQRCLTRTIICIGSSHEHKSKHTLCSSRSSAGTSWWLPTSRSGFGPNYYFTIDLPSLPSYIYLPCCSIFVHKSCRNTETLKRARSTLAPTLHKRPQCLLATCLNRKHNSSSGFWHPLFPRDELNASGVPRAVDLLHFASSETALCVKQRVSIFVSLIERPLHATCISGEEAI